MLRSIPDGLAGDTQQSMHNGGAHAALPNFIGRYAVQDSRSVVATLVHRVGGGYAVPGSTNSARSTTPVGGGASISGARTGALDNYGGTIYLRMANGSQVNYRHPETFTMFIVILVLVIIGAADFAARGGFSL